MEEDGNTEDLLSPSNSFSTPLSPIVELNESGLIVESLVPEEMCTGGTSSVTGQSEDYNKEVIMDEENLRYISTEPAAVTPPEVLRKKIFCLQSENEHLTSEYKELIEFTQLEKQIIHADCIPKDKVDSPYNDELSLINQNVQRLMEENLDLKSKLEEKTEKINELERVLADNLRNQDVCSKSIAEVALRLSNIVEVDLDEIARKNPSLEYLLRTNSDEHEQKKFSFTTNLLEGFEDLFYAVIQNTHELKLNCEKLNSYNIELNQVLEQRYNNLELKMMESDFLLKITRVENVELKTKMEAFTKYSLLEGLQEVFILIFEELETVIDSWSSNKITDYFQTLTCNNKLLAYVNQILNSKNESSFFQLLGKIMNKLTFFNKENDSMSLQIQNLNCRIEHFENETHDLKTKFNLLDYQVKDEIISGINKLENILNVSLNEKIQLEERCNIVDVEKKALVSALSDSEHNLKKAMFQLEKITYEKLENEIATNKEYCLLGSVQRNINLLFNELKAILNLSIGRETYKVFFVAFQNYISNLPWRKMGIDSDIKIALEQFVEKLQISFLILFKENEELHFILESRVKGFEREANSLKTEVDMLDYEVKELMINRISTLEEKICNTPENCIPLDAIHKELCHLFKEFDSTMNPLNYISKFHNIMSSIHTNEQMFPCINLIMDSHMQSFMFSILKQFEIKFKMYNTGFDEFQQKAQENNYKIRDFESETIRLKNTINHLESENATLREREKKQLLQLKYSSEYSEQLKTLNELMMREILSLDSDENKHALLRYSTEELFNKLMQIIMKKEGEVTSSIQKETKLQVEKLQESLVNVSNKLKSTESWATWLEIENEKMNKDLVSMKENNDKFECKIKALSDEKKCQCNEIYKLKNKVIELSNENDGLTSELNVLKESTKVSQDSTEVLQIDLENIKKELVAKTKIITDLQSQQNKKDTKCEENSSNNEIRINKCTLVDNIWDSDLSKPLCLLENTVLESEHKTRSNQHVYLSIMSELDEQSEENEVIGGIKNQLKKEKLQLKDLLKNNTAEIEEQCITCFDQFPILNDIVREFGNKLKEVKVSHASNLNKLHSIIESKNRDLSSLKSCITITHNDLFSDICTKETIAFRPTDIFIEDYCEEMSLKQELEFVKEECADITNKSKNVQQSVLTGQQLLKNMNKEFQTIRVENSSKIQMIEDLHETIKIERDTNIDQKIQMDKYKDEIKKLKLKNTYLEKQIKELLLQIKNIRKMVNNSDLDFPFKTEDMNNKILYLIESLKDSRDNKETIIYLTRDVRFFSNQCDLMISYINNIEQNLVLAQEENNYIQKEFVETRDKFLIVKKQCNETNTLLHTLNSKLPVKATSTNQIIQVMSQIIDENTNLRTTECTLQQDYKIVQFKLSQELKELDSSTKLVSYLKMELAKCEDNVRTLRSQLRSVRLQCQKKEADFYRKCSSVEEKKVDRDVQTDVLCCKELQQQLLKQKELLEVRCRRITSLQLQMHADNSPHKKKVKDLEHALEQAKERIKSLNIELMKHNDFNRDLTESFESHKKHHQELKRAYKELETSEFCYNCKQNK